MLFLLNYKIKDLFFSYFTESVCSDKSKLCDYFGTVPYKFYHLRKSHIRRKERFLFHFILFLAPHNPEVRTSVFFFFLPFRRMITADCLQIALISSI